MEEQHHLGTQLHAFLMQSTTSELAQLNSPENKPTTCMINLPKLGIIHIIHSLGFATKPIGSTSPISNNILMQTGDGTFINHPQVLMLPATNIHRDRTTEPEFNVKILTTTAWPLFKHTQMHDRAYVLKIMPIPLFLANDGFDQDIDAIVLCKHFQGLHDQDNEYIKEALSFLWTCMVRVEDGLFLNMPHPLHKCGLPSSL